MSDNEFIQGDAGAANITLVEAGRRKPGSLLMMKGEFPCKVVSFSTAKPGKHGSAKAMITGKDIFTDKQYERIVCFKGRAKQPPQKAPDQFDLF